MSKLELSLDEVIKSDKKKKPFGGQKAKQTARGGGGSGRGGRGGARSGGGGGGGGGSGFGGRQQGGGVQERRQAGGAQRGQRRTRGQRATPYDKGNPEAAWSHDLYNEEEEGRRSTGGRDLGNTGFLKRSLSGGGGGETTVEITNLSYDVSDSELNGLLGEGLIKVHINFDRSGRSEGTAKAVFESREAANAAIRELDGVTFEGQVLSLAIVANETPRNKRGGGGGAKKVGDGTFQVSTSGGRKVITRVRAADDRALW